MTPGEDLEDELRANLKRRRELAAEVAGESKRATGWGVVFWVGLVLIPVLVLCGVSFVFHYMSAK